MTTRFAFSLFGAAAILALGLTATAVAKVSEPAGVAAHAVNAASTANAGAAADPAALQASHVERGRYIVSFAGCDDCHTPKKMGAHGPELDFSRRLSGHPEGSGLPPAPALPEGPWLAVAAWDLTAWNGPWGTSFAMNLTPDENTGLGIWTEDMFLQALRTGRHMGQSRPILPPMPWEVIRNMTDDDLKAVYAFLRSIPPIHNRVPEPLPPPGQAQEDPLAAR